jgi:hypothetical protein
MCDPRRRRGQDSARAQSKSPRNKWGKKSPFIPFIPDKMTQVDEDSCLATTPCRWARLSHSTSLLEDDQPGRASASAPVFGIDISFLSGMKGIDVRSAPSPRAGFSSGAIKESLQQMGQEITVHPLHP